MRITGEEFRARLDQRMLDPYFKERTMAANAATSTLRGRVISVAELHLETDAERFLDRVEGLAGPIGTDLRSDVVRAFAHREPPRSIVARVARSLAQNEPGTKVEGQWTPSTVAELVTCPAAEFAERLYRTFLWRDPSAVERGSAEGRLAAGVTRQDIILTVASLPSAIASPHAVEGVVHVPALLAAPADVEFVQSLYHEMCERSGGRDEVNGWLAVLRNGMSRTDVLRRFIALTRPIGIHRVFVGLPPENTARRPA